MVAERVCQTARVGTLTRVTPDEELMVIFGALHLVALVLGVVLFVMFLRSEAGHRRRPPEDDDGGGGGNDRLGKGPKSSPSGGIPLPDAEPAPVRLRGPGKLADLLPRRERRRVVEPARPGRRRIST
jgi:hypothetical protein